MDWRYLRGMVATGLKLAPGTVDAIALSDVWELFEHWQQWPPEHVLLNGFVGWQRAQPGAAVPPPDEQIGELQSILGPAQPLPRELRELIEWAEATKTTLKN
ncbi:MAG: hypothetical protein ABSD20_11870 [Terriglobales bacterium]